MKNGYKILSLLLVVALCMNFIPMVFLASSIQAADSWTKYTANPPVLGTEPISGEASVVYDSSAGLYKMWFTKGVSSPVTIDSFISSLLTAAGASPTLIDDLKALNLTNIANNDSAGVKAVISNIAALSEAQIMAILKSARPSIVYATSPDGINWTLQAGGLTGGAVTTWDEYGVTSPSVIRNSSNSYEMWYNGWTISTAGIKQLFVDLDTLSAVNLRTLMIDLFINRDPSQTLNALKAIAGATYPSDILQDIFTILENSGGAIGYATSTDGITWVKDTTAAGRVLTRGAGSAWDNYGAYSPTVVKTAGSYKMWYTGFTTVMTPFITLISSGSFSFANITTAVSDAVKLQIGLATSTDGITWTKQVTNPVMPNTFSASTGPLRGIACPSVLVDNDGVYQMWYTNIQADPGPLLDLIQGSTTLNAAIAASSNISIWKAVSSNGINWSSPTLAIAKGAGGTWESLAVGAPGVILKDSYYKMWYTGVKSSTPLALLNSLLNDSGLSAAFTAGDTAAAIGLATAPVPTVTPPPPVGDGPGAGPAPLTASPGLTLDANVIVNSSGVVQSDATIKTQTGDLTLNIDKGTTMLTAQGQPLTSISAVPMSTPIVPPPPPGNAIVLTYNLGPSGATFSPYLTLTLNYDPAKLPPGTTEANLVITFWDGSKWQQLETTINTTNHTVSAKVTHFSVFAIQSLKSTVATPTPSAPVISPTPTAPATTKPPVITPPATTTTPPAKPAEEAGLAWWIIVIIVVAVAAIGFVAFWRMRAKKQI